MKLSAQQRLWIIIGTASALAVLGVGWLYVMEIPRLTDERQTIDTTRAAIAATQEEQANLTALRLDQQTVADGQKQLDLERWHFSNEDAFFQLWPGLIKQYSVTCADPQLSDAAPGTTVVERTVTLSCHGALAADLRFLNAVQSTTPMIAITHVAVAPGATLGDDQIIINGTTQWQ